MVLVRSLLEKLSRDRVVRRLLPGEHGGHGLYVSPDAAAVTDFSGVTELCIVKRGRAGNHLRSVSGSTQAVEPVRYRSTPSPVDRRKSLDRPAWNTLALPG